MRRFFFGFGALALAGCLGDPGGDTAGSRTVPAKPQTTVSEAAPFMQLRPGESPLGEGTKFETSLAAGEAHLYQVDLKPGQYLGGRIEQHGVDVVVEVLGPDDSLTLEIDGPLGAEGPEHICFVAEIPGTYGLRIRPLQEDTAGWYTLQVDDLRPASDQDRNCLEATRIFGAAQRTRSTQGEVTPALIASYERALELWTTSGREFQAAITLREMGRLWAELGNTALQERYLRTARSLMHTAGALRQEVVLLNMLGMCLRRTGHLAEAEASYQDARELAQQANDERGEGTALNNLAFVARIRGEIHEAILYYERAQVIWKRLDDRRRATVTLLNLGVAYTVLGRFRDAFDKLKGGEKLALESGDLRLQAKLLNALGWVSYQAGRIEHQPEKMAVAIDSYHQAIALSRTVGDAEIEGEAQDRLGTAYHASGRLPQAMRAYRAALRLTEATGNRRASAHSRANLGWLLETWGRLPEASQELDSAYQIFQHYEDPDGLAYVLAGLAKVQRRQGNLLAAHGHIEKALDLVRSARLAARRMGARESPHSMDMSYTELYIDLLMELDQTDSAADYAALAFEMSDLARAQNLYEMLLESDIRLRSGIDRELRDRERDVQERLNRAESLAKPTIDEEKAGHQRRVRDLIREYEEVQAEIRRNHPRFAEISDPTPLSLTRARELLDPRTLILSYVLGEERSHLFVLGTASLRSYVLPSRNTIESLASTAYESLRHSRHRRTRRQTALVSAALSNVLLGPAIDELQADRLLVIGEDILHYIPFAALPRPGPFSDPAEGRLLIDDYEVVYVPSVSVLAALRRREAERNPPPGRIIVFADPVFSRRDSRVTANDSRNAAQDDSATHTFTEDHGRKASPDMPAAERHLARLRYSRAEAESITGLVPPGTSLQLLDFAATKTRAISGTLAQYRILHFATHAIIHEEHPKLSGIVLSMVDEKGRCRDGYLRLHEIYSLELPAELVVLSACRTALGERIRGDGLIGLTRGFFYAGASRLVVSLWDVPDAATAELMKQLYQGILVDGLTPAAALRRAQQQVRREPRWHRPYFWAGFVLQGDWR